MRIRRKTAVLLAILVTGLVSPVTAPAAESDKEIHTETGWIRSGEAPENAPQGSGRGQRAPSAEELQQGMEGMMPMMGQMMTVMLESMAQKLAEPKMASYYAAFMRNYYLALVKEGFTEEQALKIVSATGIPSAGQKQ